MFLAMCLQKTNKKLYLCEGEGVVEDKGQDSTWGQKELNTECVVVTVVCGLELHEDKVTGT